MANGMTVRDSNLYKDILVEAVAAQFATKKALVGTGVARLQPNLPMVSAVGGKMGTGSLIEVPYFHSLGELEDVPEGGSLTPRKLLSSKEHTSITQSGLAGEVTDWAQLVAQAGDPYAQFAAQFSEAAMRRMDTGLITKAMGTSLVHDASGFSITENIIIDATEEWGDQLDDTDGIRLLIVHSRVRRSLRRLRDGEQPTTGRRLYEDAKIGPDGKVITLPTFAGYPILCSDRLRPVGNVYPTLVCKRDAMVAWYNGDPVPETDRDILAASDVTAIHFFHAEHLYRADAIDEIKPGVLRLLTTEP